MTPGQKGAKKFLERYGEQLVCVRYRYDDQRRKRFTTIEILIEESAWSPPEKPEIVGLRVEFRETELQRRVKQAGGKWNPAKSELLITGSRSNNCSAGARGSGLVIVGRGASRAR